jgi:hypothetical protein
MSIEHKAFIFEYEKFSSELKETLEDALSSGSHSALRAFIVREKKQLKDPYEGEPLGEDWEEMIGEADPEQYGDICLTKYYEPSIDIGLGDDWEQVESELKNLGLNSGCVLFGLPIQGGSRNFDPGKIGSYFQSPKEVDANLALILKYVSKSKDLKIIFNGLIEMLGAANSKNLGLYVTF